MEIHTDPSMCAHLPNGIKINSRKKETILLLNVVECKMSLSLSLFKRKNGSMFLDYDNE